MPSLFPSRIIAWHMSIIREICNRSHCMLIYQNNLIPLDFCLISIAAHCVPLAHSYRVVGITPNHLPPMCSPKPHISLIFSRFLPHAEQETRETIVLLLPEKKRVRELFRLPSPPSARCSNICRHLYILGSFIH